MEPAAWMTSPPGHWGPTSWCTTDTAASVSVHSHTHTHTHTHACKLTVTHAHSQSHTHCSSMRLWYFLSYFPALYLAFCSQPFNHARTNKHTHTHTHTHTELETFSHLRTTGHPSKQEASIYKHTSTHTHTHIKTNKHTHRCKHTFMYTNLTHTLYVYSGENKYLPPCRFRKFGHLQRNV